MINKSHIEIEDINWGESDPFDDIVHSIINHIIMFILL